MTDYSNSFREQLDHLVDLFKKIRDQKDSGPMNNMDATFFQTLEMVIRNYDLIRNHISDEVLNQVGEPMQKMMIEMINQLKSQLGDNIEGQADTTNNEVNNLKMTIEEIDEILRGNNLSHKEIDELLDERKRVTEDLKAKQSS